MTRLHLEVLCLLKARYNPFSTRHTDGLAFRYLQGDAVELMARLEHLEYRAALVGPHGSGKTTLMEELRERLAGDGRRVYSVFVNDTSPLTRVVCDELFQELTPGGIVFLDGADLIGRFRWWRFRARVFAGGSGLVITTHKSGMLPTLLECRTSPELLRVLAEELTGDPKMLSEERLEELFLRNNGNIRDCLRDLYDFACDSN